MNGYQPKKCADKPKPPKTGSKVKPPKEINIIYICDRKKCENCSYPNCKHTSDIEHAANFKNPFGVYEEKEHDTANVKHGRNITNMHPVDEFICSECGFDCEGYTEVVTEEDGDVWFREYEFKYCPNCGAKIQEDE